MYLRIRRMDVDKVTGQRVNYKENKDNAPASYTAPNQIYKETLSFHSNKECEYCLGSGYIGRFKHICGGRCFRCLSDDYWNLLLGELKGTGIDKDTKEPVCEIRYITAETYSEKGFGVFSIGLPPIGEFEIFSTYEEAVEFAYQKFNL